MAFFLKPTNESVKPKKIYGFDIETFGNNNNFLMGSIVNNTEKYIFWNQKEMIDFCLNSHDLRNSWLYATNLGFDFLALFGNDFDIYSKFEYIIRGSEIIHTSYKNETTKSKIYFSDTMNFLKLGVENIGKIINIKKMPKPSFLGKKPKNEIEKKQLEVYNLNDSYITFKFAEYLQNGFNEIGTNIKYTIASTSKSLFTNKYLKYMIMQPSKEVIKEMYKSYYGGRTEIIQRGYIHDCFYYDINSLYPSVMKNNVFPFPNTLKLSYKNDVNIIYDYEGISLCNFKVKDLYIPLLPFRDTDKLLFCNGDFTNWQTHAEIRKAIELGYEVDIKKTYYTEKTFNPFKDFVDDLYKKRMIYKNENNNMHILYKILLNSLYGKLGQKLQQSKVYFVNSQESKDVINKMFNVNRELFKKGLPEKYKIETPDNRTYRQNGKIYHEPRIYYITDLDTENYPSFINPILAIYTTSYARLQLYNLIEKVLKKNGDVYYYDTDSIITDKNLPCNDNLGDIKKEYDIAEGQLIKPKFYYLKTQQNEDVFKLKGLMGVKTFDQFENIINTGKYEYVKFTKFKESIRRNLKFNQKLNVIKELELNDNKRYWKNKKININKLENSKALIVKTY